MTNPTNTDLAAALREIADTLPLGSQLIVRLAADRLVEPGDDWIEWDATAPGAENGPDTGILPIDVRLQDGKEWVSDGDGKSCYVWNKAGTSTITHYRLSRK